MTERTLVGIICSVSVVITCLVSARLARKTRPALGGRGWVSHLILAYGFVLGGMALWDATMGAFVLGLAVPLFGSNAVQLWQANAIGAEALRQHSATLVAKGGMRGYVLATALMLALRAAMASVLIIPGNSNSLAAWLGWGMLTSVPVSLVGAVRWVWIIGKRREAPGVASGGV